MFIIRTYMKKEIFFQHSESVSPCRVLYALNNGPKESIAESRFEFWHDLTCH